VGAYLGSVDVGAPELIILLVVLVLLFGAKKLPELARGSGRAIRIFKEEINAKDEAPDDAPEPENRTQL
jgi:sec-independent protein translocase protein TatA